MGRGLDRKKIFISDSNHSTDDDVIPIPLCHFGATTKFLVCLLLNPLSLTPSRLPRTSKLLRKRERNGKDPSRASTKEMTVKLEKVLAV
jgi:hypothetical protein